MKIIIILLLIDVIAMCVCIFYGIKTGKILKDIEETNEIIFDELSKIGMAHRIDFQVKYKEDLNSVCDTYNENLANSITEDDEEGDDLT